VAAAYRTSRVKAFKSTGLPVVLLGFAVAKTQLRRAVIWQTGKTWFVQSKSP
jgi:hypothetical protein